MRGNKAELSRRREEKKSQADLPQKDDEVMGERKKCVTNRVKNMSDNKNKSSSKQKQKRKNALVCMGTKIVFRIILIVFECKRMFLFVSDVVHSVFLLLVCKQETLYISMLSSAFLDFVFIVSS